MAFDERDPMQRFYAERARVPEPIPESLDEAEAFRIARERAGSPLRVRAFFSLGVWGMAASRVWPGGAPDWTFWLVASVGLVGIGSYYVYWSRSGGSLRILHAWMLALPSQKDPGASRFEWVLAGLTIGVFVVMFVFSLFSG